MSDPLAGAGVVELVQYPGETVYVPAGWPHLVLNLELSVAITHNYATRYPSTERLHEAIRAAEPQLLERFVAATMRNKAAAHES